MFQKSVNNFLLIVMVTIIFAGCGDGADSQTGSHNAPHAITNKSMETDINSASESKDDKKLNKELLGVWASKDLPGKDGPWNSVSIAFSPTELTYHLTSSKDGTEKPVTVSKASPYKIRNNRIIMEKDIDLSIHFKEVKSDEIPHDKKGNYLHTIGNTLTLKAGSYLVKIENQKLTIYKESSKGPQWIEIVGGIKEFTKIK